MKGHSTNTVHSTFQTKLSPLSPQKPNFSITQNDVFPVSGGQLLFDIFNLEFDFPLLLPLFDVLRVHVEHDLFLAEIIEQIHMRFEDLSGKAHDIIGQELRTLF